MKNKSSRIEKDEYGNRATFPKGTRVVGLSDSDGPEYIGHVVGYSRSSDDIYIKDEQTGRRVCLAGITVSKLS